jgi:plasmid stability protein
MARMGQVLIRNLDDEVIAAYREAAARNQRSLEAELRDVLSRWKPMTEEQIARSRERLAAIRAMTPPGVTQTPSEVLVREMRDTNGFRDNGWPD